MSDNPPSVEPLDCFRYLVRSDSGEAQYLVDLLANDGFGQCDCMDWKIRKWPLVQHGVRCYCKHLWRARQRMADDVIAEAVRQEKASKGYAVDN